MSLFWRPFSSNSIERLASLMLAFLRDVNTSVSVVQIIDMIDKAINCRWDGFSEFKKIHLVHDEFLPNTIKKEILAFLKKNLVLKSKLGYTDIIMSQSESELIAEVKIKCRQAIKNCGNY